MDIQQTWVEALNINPEKLTEWSQSAPPDKPLLVWCLEQGFVSVPEYLQWASDTFHTPILSSAFFADGGFDRRFFAEARRQETWSPWCFPVNQWDGVTYVACVEPPHLDEPSQDLIYVLADPRAMAEAWETTGSALKPVNVEPPPLSEDEPPPLEGPMGITMEVKKPYRLSIDEQGDLYNPTPEKTVDTNRSTLPPKPEDIVLEPELQAMIPLKHKEPEAKALNEKPKPAPHVAASKIQPTPNVAASKVQPAANVTASKVQPAATVTASKTQPLPNVTATKTAPTPAPSEIRIISGSAKPMAPIQIKLAAESEPTSHEEFGAGTEVVPPTAIHRVPAKGIDLNLPSDEAGAIAGVFKALANMFPQICILRFTENDAQVYKWSASLKPKVDQAVLPLNQPSFLRIVVKTQLPYHGYLVDSPLHRQFFQALGLSDLPGCVTATPIRVNGSLSGVVLALSGEDLQDVEYLNLVSSATEQLNAVLNPIWAQAS